VRSSVALACACLSYTVSHAAGSFSFPMSNNIMGNCFFRVRASGLHVCHGG
jgi:hypothetical protein